MLITVLKRTAEAALNIRCIICPNTGKIVLITVDDEMVSFMDHVCYLIGIGLKVNS